MSDKTRIKTLRAMVLKATANSKIFVGKEIQRIYYDMLDIMHSMEYRLQKAQQYTLQTRLVASGTNNTVDTSIAGDIEVPVDGEIVQIVAYVDIAGTTGTQDIDVNKAGTSIFNTVLTIDSGEKSSRTAAVAAVFSTTGVVAGDILTVDVDAIQSIASKGLTIIIRIRKI